MWHAEAHARTARGPYVPTSLINEAGDDLFASLVRSGYRPKAERYVRSLLDAPGPKTLRAVGAQWGGAAAAQRVHHFITASPWDWRPVRRALARYTLRTLSPQALVVAPAVLGRSARLQGPGPQALGAWLTSAVGTVPVDWYLMPLRRFGGTAGGCLSGRAPTATGDPHLLDAVTDAIGLLPPWDGPVVVDADVLDAPALAHRLGRHGHRFLIRTAPGTALWAHRSLLPRHDAPARTAAEIADALSGLRRPVDPRGAPVTAVAVPVVTGPPSPGLLLLGEWESARRPRALWLTNIRSLSLPALVRLARLRGRVRQETADLTEPLGLRDYAGRSYCGCHRHLTLVSAAQLLAVVHRSAESPPRPRPA
ncbi:transcriptional regulator [Streptomyces sp. TRM43335]|uniref:Transcriptional regulator n=1 Tax=Streptomyces taklimakanensis TaxID=2569853 RepID=A0A6G2BGR0_9ACTN|nr:transposase [Streptomyces taklimakanensis]MTE21465.1 transcriptional regulator [Streptomyces taklimakanensis]